MPAFAPDSDGVMAVTSEGMVALWRPEGLGASVRLTPASEPPTEPYRESPWDPGTLRRPAPIPPPCSRPCRQLTWSGPCGGAGEGSPQAGPVVSPQPAWAARRPARHAASGRRRVHAHGRASRRPCAGMARGGRRRRLPGRRPPVHRARIPGTYVGGRTRPQRVGGGRIRCAHGVGRARNAPRNHEPSRHRGINRPVWPMSARPRRRRRVGSGRVGEVRAVQTCAARPETTRRRPSP
jgi:hypothetical protein